METNHLDLQSTWRERKLEELRVTSKENKKQATRLPSLAERLLHQKDLFTEQEMLDWLNPSLKDMQDPLTIKDMSKAVDRLIEALIKQECISVYADYDLDGTSGLALFKTGLHQLGFLNILTHQPSRLYDGYGLHNKAIEELKNKGAKLLVSIDLGISNFEQVEFAKSIGLDVIITDHHLPPDQIPQAMAVVNPNRSDCDSNLKHLCGAGVAFYVLLALKREMQKRDLIKADVDLKLLLDCFVIATLTDMVPLILENRVLVKHGLKLIAESHRPGLRALARELKLTTEMTSHDLGMKYAPKLNALSRLEREIRPIHIYLEEDAQKAQDLVSQLMQINEERKALTRKAEKLSDEFLQGSTSSDVDGILDEKFIFVYSSEFHKGILGLLATYLTQKYNRPSFVASLEGEKLVGSCRLPALSSFNLPEILASAHEVLGHFGGHAQAAGFGLEKKNAKLFSDKLIEYFGTISASASSDPEKQFMYFDTCAELTELSSEFMRYYDHFGPFGTASEIPVVQFKSLRISNLKILKELHLSLELTQNSKKVKAIWFSTPKEILSNLKQNDVVDVLAEIHWNEFRGEKNIQLQIRDLKKSKI